MVKEAFFAGGSFWGIEAYFQNIKGVKDTEVGYAGGNFENPTYQDVCKDTTGHSETVKVLYEDTIISYPDLIEAFFGSHDPRSSDFQDFLFGTQYKSIIFYGDEDEKQQAEKAISLLNLAGDHEHPVTTAVKPFTVFYPAEDYHQHYYAKHGISIKEV